MHALVLVAVVVSGWSRLMGGGGGGMVEGARAGGIGGRGRGTVKATHSVQHQRTTIRTSGGDSATKLASVVVVVVVGVCRSRTQWR